MRSDQEGTSESMKLFTNIITKTEILKRLTWDIDRIKTVLGIDLKFVGFDLIFVECMKSSAKVMLDGIPLYIIDTVPTEITNPYSGEKCVCSLVATALYDYIKGAEEFGCVNEMRHGLMLFRQLYPQEYYTLLD
jgi:hypothetical protein